jgi:hypothetical protein
MTPRRNFAVRAALIATPLVAFFLYAALNWFVIEEDQRWVGMGPDAIKDPYLAYTRLIAKMQARATFTDKPTDLDSPPESGTVILASRRLVYMSPARVARLTSWVDRGGTLVAEAEPVGIDDPLLEALGVEREMEDDPGTFGRRPGPRFRLRAGTTFDWRGNGEALRADFGRQSPALRESAVHPDASTASVGGDILALSFPWGEGRVVALSSFAFLRNVNIRDLDHAELGWQLASGAPAPGGALVFLKPPRAALGEWLLEEAWPVLIAVGLLLVLWLTRIVPRFGPLLPDPEPARRRLVEHVIASGRFLWSRGERDYLVEAARERVWNTASRRLARLKSLAPAVAVEKVAESAATSRMKAHSALMARPGTEAAFVAAMHALADIESRLGSRKAPMLSPKEPQ